MRLILFAEVERKLELTSKLSVRVLFCFMTSLVSVSEILGAVPGHYHLRQNQQNDLCAQRRLRSDWADAS